MLRASGLICRSFSLTYYPFLISPDYELAEYSPVYVTSLLFSLKKPEKYLFNNPSCRKYPQIKEIFYHIKSLEYKDQPKYSFVAEKLREIHY